MTETARDFHLGEGGASRTSDEALTTLLFAECAQRDHPVSNLMEPVEAMMRLWETTASTIMAELEDGKSVRFEPLGVIGIAKGSIHGAHALRPRIVPCLVGSEDILSLYGLSTVPVQIASPRTSPRISCALGASARAAGMDITHARRTLTSLIHCVCLSMARGNPAVSFAPLGNFVCRDGVVALERTKRRLHSGVGQLTVKDVLLSSQKNSRGERPDFFSVQHGSCGSTCDGKAAKKDATTLLAECISSASAWRIPKMDGKTTVGLDTTFLKRTSPPEHLYYPPMMAQCSRLRAVPFRGAEDPGSPTECVASAFSETATQFSKHGAPWLRWRAHPTVALPKLNVDYAALSTEQIQEGSPLAVELHEAGLSQTAFFEGLYRYKLYCEGIPRWSMSPANPAWTANIIRLVRAGRFVPELSEFKVNQMMSTMHEEVFENYYDAVAQGIVHHVLHDAIARQRAEVSFVPRCPLLWGQDAFVGIEGTCGGPPATWSDVSESKANFATQVSAYTKESLTLLDLCCAEFDGLLLVDLPPLSSFLQIEAFCSSQAEHCAQVRRQIDAWLDRAANVLRRAPEAPRDGHFYDALATLLSTRIRDVVERSMHVYEGFLGRFSCTAPPPEEVVEWPVDRMPSDAFLTISMTARFGDIRFVTPLDQVSQGLVKTFQNFVLCLGGLPRLEASVQGGPASLWEVSLEESKVQESECFIARVVDRNLDNVQRTLLLYDRFEHLLHEESRVRELAQNPSLTRAQYMTEVDKLRSTEDAIRKTCPSEIRLQLLSVDCAELNETLCSKAREAVQILLCGVLQNLLRKSAQLVKSFETVVNRMVKKPTSEQELLDLEDHTHQFKHFGLGALFDEYDGVRAWLHFLFDCEDQLCWSLLTPLHFGAVYEAAQWARGIGGIVVKREEDLRQERVALESKFKEQRNKFVEDLVEYGKLVEKFREFGNTRHTNDYVERVELLRARFKRAHVVAERLHDKEERLGWERSAFVELDKGEMALEPYARLWTLVLRCETEWRQWFQVPMFHLKPLEVEEEAISMLKEAKGLSLLFDLSGEHTPSDVAREIESQVDLLLGKHIPLLQSLCNRKLEPRHWERISFIVGCKLDAGTTVSLSQILEFVSERDVEVLQEISEAASQESATQTSLNDMNTE